MIDVVIVGGGAAGLSAALVLGRARRQTLVIDAGHPRNEPSPAAHSFFTRDGTSPAELLRVARVQLDPYSSVELRSGRALSAVPVAGGFSVRMEDGVEVSARRLLLAIGVRDQLPQIPGVAESWGRGVLHCPYCHGWEIRDERIALYASPAQIVEFAPILLQWSRDLLVCTDDGELAAAERATLTRLGVHIIDAALQRVNSDGEFQRMVFADGHVEQCRALFIRPSQSVTNGIAEQLGCERTDKDLIAIDADGRTSVAGVYAAGDAVSPMQQIVIAAASGATAAMHINRDLVQADVA
ncbi:MAG TPA: NAD(P)/FAD-dependent oxidoreductase [Longimicrobiales bacterium]|nr:NAD(P)/FAD-dependent oxidoreductase [Longimicrobiales bacterium]